MSFTRQPQQAVAMASHPVPAAACEALGKDNRVNISVLPFQLATFDCSTFDVDEYTGPTKCTHCCQSGHCSTKDIFAVDNYSCQEGKYIPCSVCEPEKKCQPSNMTESSKQMWAQQQTYNRARNDMHQLSAYVCLHKKHPQMKEKTKKTSKRKQSLATKNKKHNKKQKSRADDLGKHV